MSARAQALADRFEQANRDLITLIEGMDEATWKTSHGGDTRALGVIAHHVASSYRPIMALANGTARGEAPIRPTPEQIDERAAAHMAKYANCTRGETIALLRENGAQAAAQVQTLTDGELNRGAPLTAGEIIERILIGHTTGHTSYIREALGVIA
jgi:hypothetical protein